MTFRLTPQAARDIERANTWWTENRRSAEGSLLDELGECISRIVAQPESGLAYGSHKQELVRRVMLPMTKRHLYYVVLDGVVVVLRLVGAQRGRAPRFARKQKLS